MKIEGGPPSQPSQVDTTQGSESIKQTEPKGPPPPPPAPDNTSKSTSHSYNTGAQVAEHSIAGQARAAQLKSQANSAAAGGVAGLINKATGAVADAVGKAVTVLTEPPKPLSKGSKGPEVEIAQKDLNQWRQANGHKPIKEDGNFGPEMETAVHEFQKANGLKKDNIIGSNTRDRLALENDSNFKALHDDTKKQVRDQMNHLSKDQVARNNLKDLATDPNMGKVGREGQDAALKNLADGPQSAENLNNVKQNLKERADLETNAEFKKLDDGAKKQALTFFDKNFFDKNNRDQLMRVATDPNLTKLSPAHQGEVLNAFEKSPGDANHVGNLKTIIGAESYQKMNDAMKTKTMDMIANNAGNGRFGDNMAKIVASPNFNKMDDTLKTRTLDLAANNAANNQYTTHLSNLVTHDTFGSMSTQDKTKTLNVFENTTIDGKGALLKLMDKNINGTSALLSKGYGATGPTLDSLNRLATSNINARVGDASGTPANRAKVMEDLMNELSNPAQNINQGNRGTCTVTSMTYGLAEKNPAEYARLVTDLAINGQTKLANGDTIQPPADGFAQDNGSRSVGERLLQSSLMTYANPTYQNFNAAALTNPNVNIDGVPPGFGSGMNPDNQAKVLGALHDRKYEVVTEIKYNFVAANKDVLAMTKLELEKRGGPVYTWVDWSSPGSPGSHIVEVTKIENGRVYFRNPWGGNIPGISNGVGPTDVGATPARTPPRRVEDGPNGIESMSTDDYLKGIIGIDIEKGLLFGK